MTNPDNELLAIMQEIANDKKAKALANYKRSIERNTVKTMHNPKDLRTIKKLEAELEKLSKPKPKPAKPAKRTAFRRYVDLTAEEKRQEAIALADDLERAEYDTNWKKKVGEKLKHVTVEEVKGLIHGDGLAHSIFILSEPVPAIGINNDFISELIMKYVDKVKSTVRNANGQNVFLKATFVDMDEYDEGKPRLEVLMRLKNEKITKNKINEELTKIESKNYNTLDYFLHLKEFDVLISRLSNKGGCHKGYIQRGQLLDSTLQIYQESTDKNGKTKSTKRKMKLYSFTSKNNNCAFMPFINHLNLVVKKINCDEIRKQLNIKLGTMINVEDIEKIADYFQNKYIGLGSYLLVNSLGETLNIKKYNNDPALIICLHNDHYYKAVVDHKCEQCGHIFTNNHVCNKFGKNYYQRKVLQESSNVTIRKIAEDKEFDYENDLICFDLETFAESYNYNQHTPYACGWYYKGEYHYRYGKDCMVDFINLIKSVENKLITAYNGCKFDFYFLLNILLGEEEVKAKNLIMSSGRVLSYKFGKGNKLFDLCQFLTSSLDKACKDFKITNAKSSFDHDRIKSWEDVETCRDDVVPYLKLDVLALEELFRKFNNMLYVKTKTNITSYVTISNQAYAIWTNTLKNDIEVPNIQKYEYESKGIYGGRCTPMQKEYKSEMYDEIRNAKEKTQEERKKLYKKLKKSKQYLFNADVTSLYPASMSGFKDFDVKYPIGASQWTTEGENEYKAGKVGYYTIKFEPPKDIRVPVLPRRTEEGGISWSLENGEGVYTSVDIDNALEFGYKVEFCGEGLIWNEAGDIFSDYIKTFYELKNLAEKEKNPVLRNVAKLMLNALYGKTLQKAIFEDREIVSTAFEINDFCANRKNISWIVLNAKTKRYLFSGEPVDSEKTMKITKPRQLGGFVLGYSRKLMLKYFKAIDPTLKSMVFTYTDTDSMHITAEHEQLLRKKGYLVEKINAELGLLCSDIDDEGLIIYEKNLAPKLYRYEWIDQEGNIFIGDSGTMKGKGIPKKQLEASFYDDETPKVRSFWGLKKKNINLTRQDKENGIGYFSIIDMPKIDTNDETATGNKRTFYKNKWTKMDLQENNQWYPNGYSI